MAEPSAAALASLQQLDALKTSTSTSDSKAGPSTQARQSLESLKAIQQGAINQAMAQQNNLAEYLTSPQNTEPVFPPMGGSSNPETIGRQEALQKQLEGLRMKRLAEAGVGTVQAFEGPDVAAGRMMHGVGQLAAGTMADAAAGWVNAFDPNYHGENDYENIQAAVAGRRLPVQETINRMSEPSRTLSQLPISTAEVAPAIAAAGMFGRLGMSPSAANFTAFGLTPDGFNAWEGAKMAVLPLVGRFGEGIADGLIAKGLPVSTVAGQKLLQNVAAGSFELAYLQGLSLPDWPSMTAEERKRQVLDNFALIFGMRAPGLAARAGDLGFEKLEEGWLDRRVKEVATRVVDRYPDGFWTGEKRNVTAPEGGIEDYRLQQAAPIQEGEQQGHGEVPRSIGEMDQSGSENQEAMLPEAPSEPAIGEEGPPLPEPEPPPAKPIENVLEPSGPMQQGRMAERLGVPLRRTRSAMTPVGPMRAGRMTETLRNQEEQTRQRQKTEEPQAEVVTQPAEGAGAQPPTPNLEVPVPDQSEHQADRTAFMMGWTFKPEGGDFTKGLPPELAAQVPKQWEFTDRRQGSPTEGLTVYVPVGSDRPTILNTIIAKARADAEAKGTPLPSQYSSIAEHLLRKPVEAAAEGSLKAGLRTRDARFDDLMGKPELTFTELLQAIKEREPVYAELVDKLVKAGVNPKWAWVPEVTSYLTGDVLPNAEGIYTQIIHHIQIRHNARDVAKTVMHEAIHASTLTAMHTNKGFKAEVDGLLTIAKNALHSDAYGFTNGDEFLAEAFSNREFQKDLQAITPEGETRTLWMKLVDAVKRLFGVHVETMLERVMSIADKRFSNDELLPALRAQRIRQLQGLEAPSMVREPEQLKGTLAAKEAVKPGSGTEFVREQQASEIGVTPRLRAAIEKLQSLALKPGPAEAGTPNPEAAARRAIAQRVLNDRWVRRELVQSVEGVKLAAELLGGKFTTYAELRADQATDPGIKSRAARDALETSDGLMRAMGQFRAEYEQKRGQLETELSEVMEAKEWAAGKQGIVEVLTRELREVGKELADQSGDAGALKVYEAMGNRGSAVRNAVSFMAHYADFDLVQRGVIKNAKDLMGHMANQAVQEFPDKSMEQAVGAPEEVIRYVAGLVMESEPLRESIFNGQEFLNEKAQAHPLQEFLGEISKQAKAGNYVGALRSFQTGVGKTAVEAEQVRQTAKFFAQQEKRLVLKLATLHEVKALYDGVWSDPDFRSAQDLVYQNLNVQAKMAGLGWNDFILRPILPGDEPTKLNYSDTSEAGALATLAALKDYKLRAAEYLAHPEAAGFDPDKAAGLRTFLERYELYANPTINPKMGRLMPGWVYWAPRTIFGLLGGVDQIPQVVLKYGGGFMADYASRTLNALLSAKEVGVASYKDHGADLAGALNKALASHGFDKSQLETWRRKVWNPLVGSRQYFENPWILENGSVIGNGWSVTGEDVAFLNAWRKFDKAVRRKLSGETERALVVLKNFPLLIAEGLGSGKVRLREAAETGPDTASRRMGSIYRMWKEWRGAGALSAKIDLINRNWDQLMLGYLADSANPAFGHRYSFRDEVRQVHNQGRHGQPASSFAELVDRVTGLYNAKEDREPVTHQGVGEALLKEYDGFFDLVRQEDEAIRNSKLTVKVFGGENSFNTERGAQVLPSTWYDYGSVTEPEHMAYVNGGMSKFYVEHLNAVEALNGVLKEIVGRFEQAKRNEPGLNAHRTSIAQRIEGHDFYGWADAKLAAEQVGQYFRKLETVYNVESGTPIMEGHGGKLDTAADVVVASLLSGPKANLFNSFGGFGNIVLHDLTLRNYGLVQATLRDFGHEGMRAFRELGNLIAHEGNPLGRTLIKAIEAGKPIPFLKQIGHWLALTRELYHQGRADAIVTSKELGKQLGVMWENRNESGRNVEGQPGQSVVSKAINSVETFAKMGAKALKEASVMFVDARINATAYRLVAEMEQDLINRAIKYGALRVQRAAQEGRDPYDITDIQNLFSADELVKHPLTFLRDNEQQAARLREFLKRDAEINVDARMMEFYRRSQEPAEAGTPNLFSDAERNQLLMAIAGDINLATFGNRPIASRTSRGAQRLSLFLGYPAFQLYKVASLFTHLHTQGAWRGYAQAAGLFGEFLIVVSLVGMLGIGLSTAVTQLFLGKYGSNPTIFTASTPGAAAQAAGLGVAATIPFYGGIYNLVTGNAFKNGFDLNSQFVYANLATDAARMVKEVWQTGRVDRPVINFARRWTFPANYLGQFVPQVAGLQEFSNARNILSRVAKDFGMESRLRKSSGAAGDNFGPTTPLLNDFANAVGRGDQKGIDEAWGALVKYYEGQGLKPEEARRRALSGAQSRNPISQVFGTKLTEGELAQLYSRMTPRERAVVGRVLNNFSTAITGLGGKVNLTKTVTAPKGPRTPRPAQTVAERVLGRRSRARNPLGRINRRLGIRATKPAKAGTPNRKRTRTPA